MLLLNRLENQPRNRLVLFVPILFDSSLEFDRYVVRIKIGDTTNNLALMLASTILNREFSILSALLLSP